MGFLRRSKKEEPRPQEGWKMLVCPKCGGEIGRCKGCGAFHCASCRRKYALVEIKGELHK